MKNFKKIYDKVSFIVILILLVLSVLPVSGIIPYGLHFVFPFVFAILSAIDTFLSYREDDRTQFITDLFCFFLAVVLCIERIKHL